MKILLVCLVSLLNFSITANAFDLKECGQTAMEYNEIAPWNSSSTRIFIRTIYADMTKQNRIHLFNANDFARSIQFKNKTLGYYIPTTHQIYIDQTVDKKRCPSILLHELIHAFQYSIRLPFDINLILKLVEDGELQVDQPEKLLELLSTYYEVQAHYYTMLILPNASWSNYFQSFDVSKEKIGAAVSALTMPVGLVQKIFKKSTTRESSKFIPNREKCGTSSDFNSTLTLCELYFSDDLRWAKYPNNSEYRIHKHIAEKVNQTYGFTFNPSNLNQKTFVKLHNQFERGFISIDPVSEYSRIDSIHDLNSTVSELNLPPMEFWLSEKFWAYADSVNLAMLPTTSIDVNRLRYWAELVKNSPRSVFVQGPGGQEGSSRQILIQPNFEVMP